MRNIPLILSALSSLVFSPLSGFILGDSPSNEAAPQSFTINLNNPVFMHGTISTHEGGVVTGQDFRLQAQNIEYTNRVENGVMVQKVVAEGDLMLEHGGQFFVGRRLEYDLIAQNGVLWDARTSLDLWYLGGEKVILNPDKSFMVYGGWVTTSENQNPFWDIKAGTVKVTQNHLMSARNISFRFFKFPVLWFPALKYNLKFFRDPPIKYKLQWDRGIGPRGTIRYRVFSWEHFNLFARLDYRIQRGFGGAIESDYHSADNRLAFVTKSYAARDKTIPQERGPNRYRFQGLFNWDSYDGRTQAHLTYDKMSDDKMPSDFKTEDFEIDTQVRSIFWLDHKGDDVFGRLRVLPRINRFQSMNQELPLITTGIRPMQIKNTGIITQNFFNAGYLDYAYTREIAEIFPSNKAVRMESRNMLYRPFSLSKFNFNPHIGGVGIFYSNNQDHHPVGLGVLTYGMQLNTRISRQFAKTKHAIVPYCNFEGYSAPTASPDRHFIFSIEDGYEYLNLMRLGVRNLFYTRKHPFNPPFSFDVYTYGYFNKDKSLHQIFPRIYTTMTWSRDSFFIDGMAAWNQAERVWDIANIRTLWTVNSYIAFGVEFRHRSRFDWRKADHENFFLDSARRLDDLLQSSLSDGRDTLLTKLHVRFTPTLTCHVESHHGWGRRNEPRYNAVDINVFKMLTAGWQLRVGYQFSPKEAKFSYGLSLVQ